MKRLVVSALIVALGAGVVHAQIIPRRPAGRPAAPAQPATRDTTRDSTQVKWPAPDSVTLELLRRTGYTVTRYQGDTANFAQASHALQLLAAKDRPAIVQRDSQTVVSDSGIYYSESTRRVTTCGNYRLSDPTSGQADITGSRGCAVYSLAEHSAQVTNANIPVNNGEVWYLHMNVAKVVADSGKANQSTVYGKGGTLTSCSDTIPDYYFAIGTAKRTAKNWIIGAPAVLYVTSGRDSSAVPVMWLPFIVSDTRSGRHSGILAPRIGIGDVIRNSPNYRRDIENIGYYWALNDYMDLSTWLDWRSSANSTPEDPGWLRTSAEWNYSWLNRFLSGRAAVAYTTQRDGLTNTAISWSHQQQFSSNSHFNASVNYVTSTTLQRQNTFNPYTALATIASSMSYQSKFGPASFTVGAQQTQYPGRSQVDRTLPTLHLSTTTLSLGKWLTWTPNLDFSEHEVLHIDQPGIGAYVYHLDSASGLRDSTLSKSRSSYNSTTTFNTPIQIFGYDLKNSFQITQKRNNFPEQFTIYDVETGAITDTRVYAATYQTAIDWLPTFSLPPLARNRFNLTPGISLQNVDPGPFWVATERTGGRYVHQAKRVSFNLSASPTLFGLFPGFGPFTRLRHSITPQLTYAYAPASSVSDEYLKALGRTRKGYLGNLRQNSFTFGLATNIEAKTKSRTDTNAAPQTIRLLSLNFSPITYDVERARGRGFMAGITTETWSYSLNSDLLPGFDFSSNYSLFQGSTLSDTAVFKPYLTGISATLNLSHEQNPLMVLSRLFGKAVPEAQKSPTASTDQSRTAAEQAQAQQLAAQPVAGTGSQYGSRFIIPPTQGWKASFMFSRSSPRPPTGNNVIDFDPTAQCTQIANGNPFVFDQCVAQQRAAPTTDVPVTSATAGGTLYRIPPTTSLNANISFGLTPKWTAAWQTTYDFEHHEFAMHIVQLQRDLHDWRAIFGFTQSTNGNFAFTFTIGLKAEPDLKFDYNKATVRSGLPF